ncbi:MAG: glycosyltransferase [Ardenticatenales bacterium]|nr:glycosyltransferase [Ardenticatenales bacterium]
MYTVIIPAYNAARTIGACLQALQQQTLPADQFEILVIDDGSTDDTGAIAASYGARVLRKERGRPAAARNAGIAAAHGDIVCFTDADCEPLPDWLAQIVAPLLSDNTIAGSKGVYRTRQRAPIARFVQLEYQEKYSQLAGQSAINMVDTYSAAFRRDILLAHDGFDTRFPYAEDRELAYRLAAAGCKFAFAPAAAVYHFHAATHWAYLRKKMVNGYWVAQIMRRFPEQGVADKHTPRLQKLQIALAGLFLGSSPLAALSSFWLGGWPWLLPALLLLAFAATTPRFLRHTWQHDRPMIFFAPYLLLFRSIALGCGYIYGILAPPDSLEQETAGGAASLLTLGRLLLRMIRYWLKPTP